MGREQADRASRILPVRRIARLDLGYLLDKPTWRGRGRAGRDEAGDETIGDRPSRIRRLRRVRCKSLSKSCVGRHSPTPTNAETSTSRPPSRPRQPEVGTRRVPEHERDRRGLLWLAQGRHERWNCEKTLWSHGTQSRFLRRHRVGPSPQVCRCAGEHNSTGCATVVSGDVMGTTAVALIRRQRLLVRRSALAAVRRT